MLIAYNGLADCYDMVVNIDERLKKAEKGLECDQKTKKWLLLFSVNNQEFQTELNNGNVSDNLKKEFKSNNIDLSENTTVSVVNEGKECYIKDKQKVYTIEKEDKINIYKDAYPEILTPEEQIDKDGTVFHLKIMRATSPQDIEKIIKELDSPNISLYRKLQACYEIGMFYYRRNEHKEALVYFLKAHEIAISDSKENPMESIKKMSQKESQFVRILEIVQNSLHQAGLAAHNIGENEYWSQTIPALLSFVEYTDNGLFGEVEAKQLDNAGNTITIKTLKDDRLKKQLQNVLDFLGLGYKSIGQYNKAISTFEDLIMRFPDEEDRVHWRYEAGDSYYQAGNKHSDRVEQDKFYNNALSNFQKVLDINSKHSLAHDAMYGQLLCYQGMSNEGDVYYDLLKKLVMDYPRSNHVPACIKLLEFGAVPDYNDKGKSAYNAYVADTKQIEKLEEAMKMYTRATDKLGTILLSEQALTIPFIREGRSTSLTVRTNEVLSIVIDNLKLAVNDVPQNASKRTNSIATESLDSVVKTLEKLAKKGAHDAHIDVRKLAQNNLTKLANDLTTYRDQIVLAANEASARIRAFSTIIEEIKRLETVAKKGENEDVRSKALATLVSRTSHSDEDVKVSARKAIDRALEYPKKIEEIKGLETGAKGKNEYVRRQALERLKELKDIDPDEDISGAAKDAIDRIQVTRKINDLKVLAKSSDKIIRQQALADLERLANDSDKYCSSEAKKALEEIKSEEDKKVVKVNEVTGTSKSEKTVVPEQTKVEPNTPINISEELAKKLKLDSLLRRENLLGLISSWNYNLILNRNKPQPEDILDMSITWWYGVIIPPVSPPPPLYVAESPKISSPEMAKCDKPDIKVRPPVHLT